MDINRNMTTDDLKRLTVNGVPGVDLNKPKRKKNAREKFEVELKKAEQKATRDALPFARHAAREDFDQAIKVQIDKQLRQYGSVEKPEDLILPVTDFNQYSDLKNFKVIETHERPDTNLSKHNPGLNVQSQVITYKYKDYGQTYKVMESGPDSITRAIKNRAKLDKSITEDLDKPGKKK